MSLLKWMGVGQTAPQSQPAVAVPGEKVPGDANSKVFGMENFGNTCYANSILQALYFCQPFRDLVCMSPDAPHEPEIPISSILQALSLPSLPAPPPIPPTSKPPINAPRLGFKRQNSGIIPHQGALTSDPDHPSGTHPNGIIPTPAPPAPPPSLPPTLFSALRSLYLYISLNVEDKGLVSPSAFVAKLKRDNADWRTSQHQDAHEFLNWLLNKISEEINDVEAGNKVAAGAAEDGSPHGLVADGHAIEGSSGSSTTSSIPPTPPPTHRRPISPLRPTLVQTLFQGLLTNETRCLTCQTVSSRDETFLDLSIDIEQNSSVTACLREFSKGEMLKEDNRFRCDKCEGYCDAEKWMKIKVLPNILALHLKRFKYTEDNQKVIRLTKLTYRVAFPLELRLLDTSDDAQNPDRLYELFAIVIHIGAGPHHGHYVTVVRTQGKWVLFDDDTVTTINESDIAKYFGDAPGGQGYVLFYQAVDVDLAALGLADPTPRTSVPRPVFQPMLSQEKQFVADGQVYTPFAGTSNAEKAAAPPSTAAAAAAAAAASSSSSTTPAPANGAVPNNRKGLKLDIPATPKFDPSATFNSLRNLSLAGPLTMPSLTQGKEQPSGGFFSRSLRHSTSKPGADKAALGAMTSPISENGGEKEHPPALPNANPKAAKGGRPPSRGKDKDSQNWLAARIGKDKKKGRDESPDGVPPVPPIPLIPAAAVSSTPGTIPQTPAISLTPSMPATPVTAPLPPPPVPPMPERPALGLSISQTRRPSAPGKLERRPATSPGIRPSQTHSSSETEPFRPPTDVVLAPLTPLVAIERRVQSPPVSPGVSPPRVRHATSPDDMRNSIRLPRSISTIAASAAFKRDEETNAHPPVRGRRMSRDGDKSKDDKNEKVGGKWFQRIGKEKRRKTMSQDRSEGDPEAEDAPLMSPTLDNVGTQTWDTAEPPTSETTPTQGQYIPIGQPPPISGRDESESTTSSEDPPLASVPVRPRQASPPPVSFSMNHITPILRAAPVTPPRNSLETVTPKSETKLNPRRKLSMSKPLRLSWFGKDKEEEASKTPPVAPSSELNNHAKKARSPTDASKNLHF